MLPFQIKIQTVGLLCVQSSPSIIKHASASRVLGSGIGSSVSDAENDCVGDVLDVAWDT